MTGDRNITSLAMAELQRDDWSALVLHFPGVDHVGHLRGPYRYVMSGRETERRASTDHFFAAMICS